MFSLNTNPSTQRFQLHSGPTPISPQHTSTYDLDSEFSERETPFATDYYIFSKSNRPEETTEDQHLIEQKYACLPFHSAACTLLYLAYNTHADILIAVSKLAEACIYPGNNADFCVLKWLINYLARRCSYCTLKFNPEGTSNPRIYDLCCHHRIHYSDLTIFPDASWQDCPPDTGCSTVGYMIFHKNGGALIEQANSIMPTPIDMSTSAEAEYMAAYSSVAMAAAHIRMFLYDMMFMGTKQWKESTIQHHPTTPTVLMIDNDATL